jgi:hypothetical protein
VSADTDEVRALTERVEYLEMQLAAAQFALNAQLAFTAGDYAEAYTAGRLDERRRAEARRQATRERAVRAVGAHLKPVPR